ncbi:MAG: hypothetical protein JJU10_05550 [Idiomarina sp.]|nr:hypothetical protein [Idiomarina sp.]
MSGIQLEKDTCWLLKQWAVWAKSESELLKLYFPDMAPFAKIMCRNAGKVYAISDEQALEVDRAISKLRTRDEEMSKATALFYWLEGNTAATARVLKIHRTRVDVLVAAGTAWVDAILVDKIYTKTVRY